MTKMDEMLMRKRELEKKKAERIRREVAAAVEEEISRLLQEMKKG